MLERLRELLGLIDEGDLSHVPDYSDALDYVGVTSSDSIDDIREALELEIEAAEADTAAEPEGGDTDNA